jgi:hypothetical protein
MTQGMALSREGHRLKNTNPAARTKSGSKLPHSKEINHE